MGLNMFKRSLVLGVFSAALLGSSVTAWSKSGCVEIKGWGSADNLGTAKEGAKVDLALRIQAYANRHREEWKACEKPEMKCTNVNGVRTCNSEGEIKLD